MASKTPSIAQLSALLQRSADGQLTFLPDELSAFCDATSTTLNGPRLLDFVIEMLDFAAYLEVQVAAPRAAIMLFGLVIWPLTDSLQEQARAQIGGLERTDEVAGRVRKQQQTLQSRHGTMDALAPPGAASVMLRPNDKGETK